MWEDSLPYEKEGERWRGMVKRKQYWCADRLKKEAISFFSAYVDCDKEFWKKLESVESDSLTHSHVVSQLSLP